MKDLKNEIEEILMEIGGYYPGTSLEIAQGLSRPLDVSAEDIQPALRDLAEEGRIEVDAAGIRLNREMFEKVRKFRKIKHHRK